MYMYISQVNSPVVSISVTITVDYMRKILHTHIKTFLIVAQYVKEVIFSIPCIDNSVVLKTLFTSDWIVVRLRLDITNLRSIIVFITVSIWSSNFLLTCMSLTMCSLYGWKQRAETNDKP